MISGKRSRRLTLILNSAGYTLFPSLLQIVFSLIVIRLAGLSLWGTFVEVLIIMNLLQHLLNWGARDYLLSRFAASPATIPAIWQHSLSSRLPLFLVTFACIWIIPPLSTHPLLLSIWLMFAVLAQSYDAVIVYDKAFTRAIIINLLAIAGLLGMIAVEHERVELTLLISAYSFFHVLRAVFFTHHFRKLWQKITALQDSAIAFYRAAFPFFLLGFTGLLQSRTDLYCLAAFSNESTLAQYQVFINALAYLQVIGYLLIQPFAKAVLRMPFSGVWRLTNRMSIFGTLLVLVLMPLIVYGLKFFYLIEISRTLAVVGGLMSLPIFMYTSLIYYLYGCGRQRQVVWVNVVGIFVNLFLNLWLIPNLMMIGAMIASAAAQWIMLILYLVICFAHLPQRMQKSPRKNK